MDQVRRSSLVALMLGVIALGLGCDSLRFPKWRFGFLLESGYGERVDTFSGLVTKDMVGDPDTTIRLQLSEAELDTIYEAAMAIRLFHYPEPCPAQSGNPWVPSTTMRLKIRAGWATKEFSWDTGYGPAVGAEDEWRGLRQFIRLIDRIVQSRDEYMALPRASGGYL